MWEHASIAFHPDVLSRGFYAEPSAQKRQQLASVRSLHDMFASMLFSCSPEDYAGFKHIPTEAMRKVSATEFVEQYIRLRDVFIPGLLSDPAAQQVWHVDSIEVYIETVGSRSLPVRDLEMSASTLWGKDMSLQYGCQSVVGKSFKRDWCL